MESLDKSIEEQFQLRTYGKYPLVLERGSGSEVFTQDRKRYLDFYGGHAVCLTGHCHPHVVKAISTQAQELIFYSNIVYHPGRAKTSEAIVRFAKAPFSQVFLCNSGAEANEAALKMARNHTGKQGIIAMEGGFHGRTLGAQSVTGVEKYRKNMPAVPGITFTSFGSMDAIRNAWSKAQQQIAAIILEPVQSMAGVHLAMPDFYRELRTFCDQNKIVLIFDEVQTGFGRTGRNFFGEHFGVSPDLITSAKGLGSGVPIGCVIVNAAIASGVKLGEHGTTFGGGPLACAAAKATLEVIENENLVENAAAQGRYIVESLLAKPLMGMREIRGIGLMIGIEFEREAKPIITQLLENGLITGGADDPNTLRLLPPLIVSQDDCNEALEILHRVSKEAWN